jgi:hypothetical protein
VVAGFWRLLGRDQRKLFQLAVRLAEFRRLHVVIPEYGCTNATPLALGTPLPTARAFQLFSSIAKNGEHVLGTTVNGDTANIRAYAASSNTGTALVLFNLNETTSEAVAVTVNGQSRSSGVTLQFYDKTIYDQSQNNVWAGPSTTTLGTQALPLTLTLTPWSMNVVIISP